MAGPTPGNAAFAAYYDGRLGAATRRFHNPYDIVPQGWNVVTMRTIPNLYRPTLRASCSVKLAATAAIDLVRGEHYQQLTVNTPRIKGGIVLDVDDFVEQARWQHSNGYVCGMRLDFIPVSLTCAAPDPQSAPLKCAALH